MKNATGLLAALLALFMMVLCGLVILALSLAALVYLFALATRMILGVL